MSGIAANLAQVRERIATACAAAGREAADVELLAVSKYNPAGDVREALAAGQIAFGENRVPPRSHRKSPHPRLAIRSPPDSRL